MITISIIVDGRLHATLRVFDTGTRTVDGRTVYRTPDGTRIEHDPDEGVGALARKMLDASAALRPVSRLDPPRGATSDLPGQMSLFDDR